MSYGLSPSIDIRERDFIAGQRQTANRFAGAIGNFNWGPVEEKVFIVDEKSLVENFHTPDDTNYKSWMCVANYFAYNDKLWLVRAIADGGSSNAGICIEKTGTNSAFTDLVKNNDDEPTISYGVNDKFKFLAKYPGAFGNDISVAGCVPADFTTAKIIDDGTIDLAFTDVFEFGPGTGEIAIAVVYNDTVVETFVVSLTAGSKNYKGEANYIETFINRRSAYIRAYNNTSESAVASFEATSLASGAHVAPTAADYISAYDLFAAGDEVEVDILFDTGAGEIASGETVIQYALDSIADVRRDVRFVFSATETDTVGKTVSAAVTALKLYLGTTINRDSSFGAFYGNYKYQFDRYNDVYRWVPISGDIAGIYCLGQVWEAPAGIQRGLIKNCVKLAFNPSESYRDALYPAGINPVYTLKNVGHIVMGQKTIMTSRPSLFSRTDIRGLFILLQKNAKDVGRYYKFQKNTATERRRFIADIDPLFRQIQGLGGIEEYLIVCDETNNTGAVIDNNTMIADFYVKPAQSAEWLLFNFNALSSSVILEDVVSSPFAR